jgi:hypothetical protein
MLPSRAAVVQLVCALGAMAAVGWGGAPLVRSAPSVAGPPAAATFIAAHAAGDAGPVAGVVSPLYRAELVRRGRAAAWPLEPLWAEAAPRLAFAPVATIADGHGFVHALYVARPRSEDEHGGPATVWRVDLDPAGRVVWGEPARLLTGPTAIPVPTGAAPAPLVAALDALSARLDARLGEPVGVGSAAGDGYFGVSVRRPGRPDAVVFVIVDEEGDLAPDAWSFGQPIPLGDPDDHHALAPPFGLRADGLSSGDRDLLRSYLGAIGPRLPVGGRGR